MALWPNDVDKYWAQRDCDCIVCVIGSRLEAERAADHEAELAALDAELEADTTDCHGGGWTALCGGCGRCRRMQRDHWQAERAAESKDRCRREGERVAAALGIPLRRQDPCALGHE